MNTTETQPILQLRHNVTVQWLVPERVILIQAKGTIDVIDRETAHSQIMALIHSCATPEIHIISDTKQMTHIAWSVFNRPSMASNHPRRGWWMNIGTVPTVRLKWLARLLSRLSRRRYVHCETMEEALQNLQRLDPTLPDLMVSLKGRLQATVA